MVWDEYGIKMVTCEVRGVASRAPAPRGTNIPFPNLCSSSRQDGHVRRWGRYLFVDAALEPLCPVRGAVGRVPGPTIWLNAVQLDIRGGMRPSTLHCLYAGVPSRCAGAEEEDTQEDGERAH